jgi:hypothetical protein
MKKVVFLHLLDPEWEVRAAAQYRSAYPELKTVFRERLHRGFLRSHWIPDRLSLQYLTRLLIRFLPAPLDPEMLEMALALREVSHDDPGAAVRLYENAGEMILWYTGMSRRTVLQDEGKESYEVAYRWLRELEADNVGPFIHLPGSKEEEGSDRLRVDRMLAERFENYREILEQSELLEDHRLSALRRMFLTDEFSFN